MSRNGTLLALPPGYTPPPYPLLNPSPYPRSIWLRRVEDDLRAYYPSASTADLSLTARTHAPFYLAQPGQR
jgi:hypothetical protein